jgi:hypothetical protein
MTFRRWLVETQLGWPGDDVLIAFNAAWAAYKRAMKKLPQVVA